jgi:hypothetical protein
MTGSPLGRHRISEGGRNLAREEGDESIDDPTDEAAKTKKELRENTSTGKQVQEQGKHE